MWRSNFDAMLTRLESLPEIQARHVDALYRAVEPGKEHKVKDEVDDLLARRFDAFSDKAARRLVSRFQTTLPTAKKLDHKSVEPLDVEEASGVAPLTNGRMLVIDDKRGVYFVDADGKSSALISATDKDHDRYDKRLEDLEGITTDNSRQNAYLVSEGTRTIFHFPIDDDGDKVTVGQVRSLGVLPAENDGTVNGWEGIAVMPGKFLGGGEDFLVAIHEAEPTLVSFFSIPNEESDAELKPHRTFKVPRQARPHLVDISDIAVHPDDGHLFLVSDRQRTIVELELKVSSQAARGGMFENLSVELVGVTEIPDSKGTKPEGIGFDPDNGDVVLVAEKGHRSRVHRFEVT